MKKAEVVGWLKNNWLLILIIITGSFVRIYEFGDIPQGLNQDEASGGYDSWSIYHYGIDRNGWRYPLIFQGLGAGQNSLHQYLAIPFVAAFGLNVVSIRLVDLVFGIIAIILLYLFVKEIWNKETALFATFLLAISPWHIMLSRWGMDENLFPVFFLIANYLLILSLKKEKYLPFSFLFFAISLYGHNVAYYVVPVFVALASAYLIFHKKIRLKVMFLSFAVFFVVALPILLYILINTFNLSPIEASFFSIPKVTIPPFKQSTFFTGNMLSGAQSNFQTLIKMLISQNDGKLYNQLSPYGFIYYLGMILAIIGLFLVLYSNRKIHKFQKSFFVLLWFLVLVSLGFFIDCTGNRFNAIFIPLIIFSAIVAFYVKAKVNCYLYYLIVLCYLIFFVNFSHAYFNQYPTQAGSAFFQSYGDAVSFAINSTSGPICITSLVNLPHIYVLFYGEIDPIKFAADHEDYTFHPQWKWVKRFDRYYFGGEGCKLAKGVQVYLFHESEANIFKEDKFTIKRFNTYGVATRLNSSY